MTKGYDEFSSMAGVRAAFSAAGSYWFSKGAMQFFRTKIESSLIGGRYFITSEKPPYDVRKFSVRKVVRHDNGSLTIETIGEFCSHETIQEAREALKEYRAANN